jgi:hypothetical protein
VKALADVRAVRKQVVEIAFDYLAAVRDVTGDERKRQGECATGGIRDPVRIVVQLVHAGTD